MKAEKLNVDHWQLAENTVPIFVGIVLKKPASLEWPVRNNAYVNLASPDEGITPLIFSVYVNNADAVSFLLKNGADPKIRSKEGKTALDVAKEINNQIVIGLLNTK